MQGDLFQYTIDPATLFEEIVFDPRMTSDEYKSEAQVLKRKYNYSKCSGNRIYTNRSIISHMRLWMMNNGGRQLFFTMRKETRFFKTER